VGKQACAFQRCRCIEIRAITSHIAQPNESKGAAVEHLLQSGLAQVVNDVPGRPSCMQVALDSEHVGVSKCKVKLLKHPPTLMVWKWVLVQDQHSSHCCVVLATIANDELHTFSVVPAKHVKPREGTSAELLTPADARVNADRSIS